MRTIIFLFFILISGLIYVQTTQYKLLDNSDSKVYYWKFDGNVSGVSFYANNNGVPVAITDESTKISQVEDAASSAFGFWAGYTQVSFQQVGSSQNADIVVQFTTGDSGSFGSASGGSVYLYTNNRGWTSSTAITGYLQGSEQISYLYYALSHEIGHLVNGPGHITDGCIMDPYWGGTSVSVSSALAAQIQERYFCRLTVESSIGTSIKVGNNWLNSGTSVYVKHSKSYSFEVTDNVLISSYYRAFKEWDKNYQATSTTTATANFTMPDPPSNTSSVEVVYGAKYGKKFNISFNPPSNVQVYVNGQIYSGNPVTVIEGNTLNVSVGNYTNNSILYSPNGWSLGGTNYSANIQNYYPDDHKSFTWLGSLVIKPVNDYRNMSFNSTIGDPVTISWSEHPDANVGSYKIYRKLYGESTGTYLASVNRGSSTQVYVDADYLITDNTSPYNRKYYDVRAIYNGQIESDPDFQMQFAIPAPKIEDGQNNMLKMSLIPSDYSLNSYPNPFNPTTVIRYQLPQESNVSLKVYNILSQEVAALENETKSAGIHTVNFNANNLPSGIYIARLQAGSKVLSIKLQLVK